MMRGLRARHGCVVDAELVDGADAQVFEHDVGALEQLEEQIAAVGLLQVEREAPFVAIQVDEVGRLAAVERRAPARAPCRRRRAARS